MDYSPKFHEWYQKMSGIELQPIAQFLGGIVQQEIIKRTGKFTPIPGFFHFHALETLPSRKEKDGDGEKTVLFTPVDAPMPGSPDLQNSRYLFFHF